MARDSRAAKFDPFCDVSIKNLELDGVPTGYKAVVLKQEGEEVIVGQVSSNYTLVPNIDLSSSLIDSFNNAGFNYTMQDPVFNGRVFRQRFIMNDSLRSAQEFVVPGGHEKLNELLDLHIDLINSYDATRRYGLSVGATVLVCTNGLILNQYLGNIAFRHQKDMVDMDVIVAGLQHAVRSFSSIVGPTMIEMMGEMLDITGLAKLINDAKLPDSVAIEGVKRATDKTEWGFLMGVSNYTKEKESIKNDDHIRRLCNSMF
jgi:hypothetical protein